MPSFVHFYIVPASGMPDILAAAEIAARAPQNLDEPLEQFELLLQQAGVEAATPPFPAHDFATLTLYYDDHGVDLSRMSSPAAKMLETAYRGGAVWYVFPCEMARSYRERLLRVDMAKATVTRYVQDQFADDLSLTDALIETHACLLKWLALVFDDQVGLLYVDT
jgi:hypothetical protein